ncbi:hypothetical protein F5877DRAFT_79212 [Lentinula edodes]|nr:hypothetical protein F5877DRAFT_79212 [Lentinula edodes]
MLVLEFDSAWPFNVNILSPAPQGWTVIKNFLETSPPLPFPFSLSSSFPLSSTSTTWTDEDSFSCLPSALSHTDNGNNNKVDTTTTTTTPTRNIPPPSPEVAWFPPVMPLDSAVEGVYVRASEPCAQVNTPEIDTVRLGDVCSYHDFYEVYHERRYESYEPRGPYESTSTKTTGSESVERPGSSPSIPRSAFHSVSQSKRKRKRTEREGTTERIRPESTKRANSHSTIISSNPYPTPPPSSSASSSSPESQGSESGVNEPSAPPSLVSSSVSTTSPSSPDKRRRTRYDDYSSPRRSKHLNHPSTSTRISHTSSSMHTPSTTRYAPYIPACTVGLMEFTIDFSHTNNTPKDEARFVKQCDRVWARGTRRDGRKNVTQRDGKVGRQAVELQRGLQRRLSLTSNL